VLPDSNVYGPVVGLWRLSISFHSPRRATLYSLPYPLRIGWHPDDRAVPHGTKTLRAVIDAGVAPEQRDRRLVPPYFRSGGRPPAHLHHADTISRRGQSDAIYQAKSRYRLRSGRASSLEDLPDIRRTLVPGASGRKLIDHDRVANVGPPNNDTCSLLSNQPERTLR
jgi:hypothetical protein